MLCLTSFSKHDVWELPPFYYIHFSVDGHVSFPCSAVLNKAAIIILVHVF